MQPSALEQVRSLCAATPGASLDHTFGADTDIYRVGQKMFALVNTDEPGYVTLKARPEEVQALLARYDFCRPGYYMNKRHWVTFDLAPDVPLDEVSEAVAESYRLVFESLPKKRQSEIIRP